MTVVVDYISENVRQQGRVETERQPALVKMTFVKIQSSVRKGKHNVLVVWNFEKTLNMCCYIQSMSLLAVCVFKRHWVCGQQRHWRTQRLRLDGQDAALQRDTSSEVTTGSFECTLSVMSLRAYLGANARVWACVCARWVGLHMARNGSQWTCVFRTGPCGRREKGERAMVMRVGGGWPMGSSRDGAAC